MSIRFEESPDTIYGETAHLYDYLPRYTRRTDREFYISEARKCGGRVLELGCGTGRVLLPIARAGVPITGLDLAEPMLAVLQEKLRHEPQEVQARVNLVLGTMLDFHMDNKFPLITTPFRSFQHLLTVDDQEECLRHVQCHLLPDGRFILDLFQPDAELFTASDVGAPVEDVPETPLPDGRTLRRITRIAAVRQTEQIADLEMVYHVTDGEGRKSSTLQAFRWRYFFPDEVECLLARCGFDILEIYGDYDRSPLTDMSPEMIFIAKQKPA